MCRQGALNIPTDPTQPWCWRRCPKTDRHWRRCLMAFPGETDTACLCRANSCRFTGLQGAGCAVCWSSFNTENVEIWGWLSNARTHLLLSPLSFSSLTHTLPGHILQMLYPSKRTKFISSWYFAFNSQLLLSMLRGHTSLSLSSARDFCDFLGKPLRIWPAGEIRG